MERRRLFLSLLLALPLLSGCSGAPPTDAVSSPSCETSHTSIAAMQGEAGYNDSWDPPTIRAQLDRAGFKLRGPEFGVDGRDPAGHNFSLVQSGTPRVRYAVTFDERGEMSDEARLAARVAPAANESIRAFEDATGWTRVSYEVRPILVTADFLRC